MLNSEISEFLNFVKLLRNKWVLTWFRTAQFVSFEIKPLYHFSFDFTLDLEFLFPVQFDEIQVTFLANGDALSENSIVSYLNFEMANITLLNIRIWSFYLLQNAKILIWLNLSELRKAETWTNLDKVTRFYFILFSPILQWKLEFERIFNVYLWKMLNNYDIQRGN